MELRAEHRQLQLEASDFRREAQSEMDIISRQESRGDQAGDRLRGELEVHQDELRAARTRLQNVSATSVLEDEPENSLRKWRRECVDMTEAGSEFDSSRMACEELAERLGRRIDGLQAEVARAKLSGKALRIEHMAKMTPAEISKLHGEVKVLSAKVAVTAGEVDEEARHLWLMDEKELPRLRQHEAERRRLQNMLAQAQWDRDSLQRDYNRIITGLREQQQAQGANERELRSHLAATRTEGEEMVATMRAADLRLQETRQDCWETECFVRHLTEQVESLEEERRKLRISFSVSRPGSGQPGRLADLSPAAQDASIAWMRQDNDRLVNEVRAAGTRDEEEARVVGDECMEAELRLVRAEERNVELRSETAALAPLLQKTSAHADDT